MLQFLYMVLISSPWPRPCHYECRTAGSMQHRPCRPRTTYYVYCILCLWKNPLNPYFLSMMVCLSNLNNKFPNCCSNFPAVPAANLICSHLQAVLTLDWLETATISRCPPSHTVTARIKIHKEWNKDSSLDHKMIFCLSPLQMLSRRMISF